MPRLRYNQRMPLAKIRLRFNPGLTLQKAAQRIGTSHSSLARYENGISDVPTQIVARMAFVYGVDIKEISQAVLDTAEIVKARAENNSVAE